MDCFGPAGLAMTNAGGTPSLRAWSEAEGEAIQRQMAWSEFGK
jgi:hypothetical protein